MNVLQDGGEPEEGHEDEGKGENSVNLIVENRQDAEVLADKRNADGHALEKNPHTGGEPLARVLN